MWNMDISGLSQKPPVMTVTIYITSSIMSEACPVVHVYTIPECRSTALQFDVMQDLQLSEVRPNR